ncbi:uncharacterized protein ACRADG_012874 [Cochliomyia hominivorax]
MFYKETSYLFIIILILLKLNNRILASKVQNEPNPQESNFNFYNFKKRFNNVFQNPKSYRENERKNNDLNKLTPKSHIFDNNIINKFSFIGDELFNQNNEPSEIFEDEDYENSNNKIWNILLPKNSYSNALIYRRDIPSDNYIKTLENSSLYPSVLTKALEVSLKPSDAINTGGSILTSVAQKLNTTTIDLAEKLTKSESQQNNDPFGNMIQNYLKNIDFRHTPAALNDVNPLDTHILKYQPQSNNFHIENEDHISEILEQVLSKLDKIQSNKNNDKVNHPDGAPCDIIGSWSSTSLGLCFNIQLLKNHRHDIPAAEINNKILAINVEECVPAKQHQFIDLDWRFSGSALKQMGGPFYAYGQKRSENVMTTFVGVCRICDGIDTIFGSWNFLLPSKDCNDISLAFEVKRDVLRRMRLEMKRKERFKNLLYQSRIGKS